MLNLQLQLIAPMQFEHCRTPDKLITCIIMVLPPNSIICYTGQCVLTLSGWKGNRRCADACVVQIDFNAWFNLHVTGSRPIYERKVSLKTPHKRSTDSVAGPLFSGAYSD